MESHDRQRIISSITFLVACSAYIELMKTLFHGWARKANDRRKSSRTAVESKSNRTVETGALDERCTQSRITASTRRGTAGAGAAASSCRRRHGASTVQQAVGRRSGNGRGQMAHRQSLVNGSRSRNGRRRTGSRCDRSRQTGSDYGRRPQTGRKSANGIVSKSLGRSRKTGSCLGESGRSARTQTAAAEVDKPEEVCVASTGIRQTEVGV